MMNRGCRKGEVKPQHGGRGHEEEWVGRQQQGTEGVKARDGHVRSLASAVGEISAMYTGTEVEAMPTASPHSTRPTISTAKEGASAWSSHAAQKGREHAPMAPLLPRESQREPPARAPNIQPTLTTEPKAEAEDEESPQGGDEQLASAAGKSAEDCEASIGMLEGEVKPRV